MGSCSSCSKRNVVMENYIVPVNQNLGPAKSKSVPVEESNPKLLRLVIQPPPSKILHKAPLPKVDTPHKENIPHKKNNNKPYQVKSNINKKKIKCTEELSNAIKREFYRYQCPVCLRHFENMLNCSNCKNYICRFCGDEIGEKPIEMIKCPFCAVNPFILTDVDSDNPIRKYTDSYYSVPESNNKRPNRQNINNSKNCQNEVKKNTNKIPKCNKNTRVSKSSQRYSNNLERIEEKLNKIEFIPATSVLRYDVDNVPIHIDRKKIECYDFNEINVRSLVQPDQQKSSDQNSYDDSRISILSI